MSKIQVPVAYTVGRVVRLDPDATKGATLGKDLYDEDGNVLTLDALAAAVAALLPDYAAEARIESTVPEPTLAVSPSSSNISRFQAATAPTYAILELNSSGAEFANISAGSTSMTLGRGSWLDAGTSAEVWVERILDSGTLNHADPGAGRLQLSTTRLYGISRSTDGTTTSTVTFNYYDAATGGNLIGSATITFTVVVGTL